MPLCTTQFILRHKPVEKARKFCSKVPPACASRSTRQPLGFSRPLRFLVVLSPFPGQKQGPVPSPSPPWSAQAQECFVPPNNGWRGEEGRKGTQLRAPALPREGSKGADSWDASSGCVLKFGF